jgi:hypothetical protein
MKNELSFSIELQIKDMNEAQLIELNNRYCEIANYPDNYIYSNDEEFFEMLGWSGLRVAQATFYGNYNYSHAWVTFDGYGNLQSYHFFTVDQLIDFPSTMAEFIEENFEQFEDLFQ